MADTDNDYLTSSSDLTPQVESVLRTTKVIPLHTHNGTDSLQVNTGNISNNTPIAGAITFAAGNGVTLTQNMSIITIGANAQTGTQTTFTAAENISAGAAVAATLYQTTDIGYDTSGTLAPADPTSASITVANNPNRGLIVILMSNTSSSPTITYGGAALALTSSSLFVEGGNIYRVATYFLANPTVGTATLSINNSSNGIVRTFYWSLYNCGAVDNSSSNGSANGSVSTNLILGTDGCLTVGGVANIGTVGTATGNVYVANNSSGTSGGTTYSIGTSGVTNIFGAGTSMTLTSSGGTSNVSLIGIISIKPINAPLPAVQNASSASANQREQGFVGFASASATTGQPIIVTTSGVATGLSLIATGTQYYLNDTNGTIGTSAGSVTRKVGIGTSNSSILVTNIW